MVLLGLRKKEFGAKGGGLDEGGGEEVTLYLSSKQSAAAGGRYVIERGVGREVCVCVCALTGPGVREEEKHSSRVMQSVQHLHIQKVFILTWSTSQILGCFNQSSSSWTGFEERRF